MPRNLLIQIKVSAAEKAQVKADADRMSQNVSEYARSLLLHKRDSHNEILDPPQPSYETKNMRLDSEGRPKVADIEVKVHEGVEDQELEFKKQVNRYATRMSARKAEAIVRKEMGL